jgi:hypothetical protein
VGCEDILIHGTADLVVVGVELTIPDMKTLVHHFGGSVI